MSRCAKPGLVREQAAAVPGELQAREQRRGRLQVHPRPAATGGLGRAAGGVPLHGRGAARGRHSDLQAGESRTIWLKDSEVGVVSKVPRSGGRGGRGTEATACTSSSEGASTC